MFAACVVAALAASGSAYAYSDTYSCWIAGEPPCVQGGFHHITYNRVHTGRAHVRVCAGMQTEAGGHRGGKNFCVDNTDSADECFNSASPASQAFGFFLDQGGATYDIISGFVDDSPNHTGCI
jgi:hypothetical protein